MIPGVVTVDPALRAAEKIYTEVFEDEQHAAAVVVKEIAEAIEQKAKEGKKIVLGMATGSTPLSTYAGLIKKHKEENLSFKNVVTFNLDEYYPMAHEHKLSYHHYMHNNFFNHIDILPENINIPDGTLKMEEVDQFCKSYEKKISDLGGIDIIILGIGRDGHVGFNEPGSKIKSTTRLVQLDKTTRLDAAGSFCGLENVPRLAITMGVGTILNCKRVIILAYGEPKAHIAVQAIEGEVTPNVACSYLQGNKKCTFYLDKASASLLTRYTAPWSIHGQDGYAIIKFDDFLTRKAVFWLAQKLKKPILRLIEDDYLDNGLTQLLQQNEDSISRINIKVYRSLADTITGWPAGGRPVQDHNVDYYQKKSTALKKILIFSPHPDDDVICMGGTIMKLCNQGHEVYVAYQTSGNNAVFDYDVRRHVNFVKEMSKYLGLEAQKFEEFENKINEEIKAHKPGFAYSSDMLKIKALIRQTEARSAAIECGVRPDRIYNLYLPFYETGSDKKNPLCQEDYDIIKKLIDKIEPNQIYCAGDMTDPNGTHRVCLKAILQVLKEYEQNNVEWFKNTEVLFYRGAWQEWEPEYITLSVPMSPQEVIWKRLAIFKHESQKDPAPYAGNDPREFWQRIEERNKKTAKLFDLLGLQEYEAIEVFVNWKLLKGGSGLF